MLESRAWNYNWWDFYNLVYELVQTFKVNYLYGYKIEYEGDAENIKDWKGGFQICTIVLCAGKVWRTRSDWYKSWLSQ